jgi:hypothetical protein
MPQLLLSHPTYQKLTEYLASLRSGEVEAGHLLRAGLGIRSVDTLSEDEFIEALIDTKPPMIFAESAVVGDGSDWTLTELNILGDMSIAVPALIFDNGHHTSPKVHNAPFQGTLIFTPGALLRNGYGRKSADWDEVTNNNGEFDPDGYYRLYTRRLLPVFEYVNATALAQNRHALITIPGLGCGQFAGRFRGQLGEALAEVLKRFLKEFGTHFPSIKVVYYDPYNECSNSQVGINGISLRIRPLTKGNVDKSQLCHPTTFAEDGDNFSRFSLFSIVAWDHVSWPGNDYFGGSRFTDDGVKAAASNSMAVITGIEGRYEPDFGMYTPPAPYRVWKDVVEINNLRLSSAIAGKTIVAIPPVRQAPVSGQDPS